MAKYYLLHRIYSLLLVLIFITSCNGQTKAQSQADNVSEQKAIPVGQPGIMRPQGRNEGDNVRCGLQDKAGNLWFCTAGEGVYRYDGKLFTNFTEKDGLNSNIVYSILEDKSGNLWFGTSEGICRYDGKNIIRIPITGIFLPTISNNNYYNYESTKNTVWSMLQDKSGNIWFGTGEGVYYYDGKNFTHFLDNYAIINKDSIQLKMVDCILEDKSGNIWFASGMSPGMEGICRYDGKSITNFKPNGERWIRSMLEDKNGNIWFGTRHKGLWRYDGKTYTNFSQQEGLDSNMVYSVTSIIEDKAGNLWFAEEDNGVWCYNGKTFTHFTTANGLSNNRVWSITEDKAGNIWIGSRGNGLCRYDGKTFTNFTE